MGSDNQSQLELNQSIANAVEAICEQINELDKMSKSTHLLVMTILSKNPVLEAEVIQTLEMFEQTQSDNSLGETATEALRAFK